MISLLEGTKSTGGSKPSEVSRKGKRKAKEEGPQLEIRKGKIGRATASIRLGFAQVVFNLRRQNVIQGKEMKRLKSDYSSLISSVGKREEKVAGLENQINELEDEIRHLRPNP